MGTGTDGATGLMDAAARARSRFRVPDRVRRLRGDARGPIHRRVRGWLPLLVAALGVHVPARALAGEPAPVASRPGDAIAGPSCVGEYADNLDSLLPRARDVEREQASYTFCIRATATYECPYYTADGMLRRKRRRVTAHGTGFAYQQVDGATLVLTNDHVAEWPAATDAAHKVEDVPPGCRRVSDTLKVVKNESDAYERDDVPLSRVVTDPALDVAVLKASGTLPVIPWSVGRSAALRERNVVNVRGFPLGVFQADNVGKVISPFDHDEEGDWDHDDFVVDALLSPGNSGSPVLAVSCKTGQFELVGIYHAAYSRGTALNVVVGIDQVRDLMTTLKRGPRRRAPRTLPLDGEARAALVAVASAALEPHFQFGGHPAAVRVRADGALLFEVLPRDFPATTDPLLVIEDLPPQGDGFGALGRVWAGRGKGLKAYARSALDADAQAQLERTLDALRRDARSAFELRAAAVDADASRASFDRQARLERDFRRATAAHHDVSQGAADLAERLAPEASDRKVSLAEILAVPSPRRGDQGAAPIEPAPIAKQVSGVVPAAAAEPVPPAATQPPPRPGVTPPSPPGRAGGEGG